MPLPLALVLKAAEELKREAIRNKRLRPATRVRMMLQAQQMPAHWAGRRLIEKGLSDDAPRTVAS